jgi:AcrR family transcriptional regulator
VTEGKRVYRSALRAAQAERTRSAVVDAATRCFVERGYARTTMRDIAQAADVAVQTVFAQGSKASLLLAAVDRAVVGDDEDAPLLQRELFSRLFAAPDLHEKLAVFREIARVYVPQTGPMMKAFAAAAAVDEEIATAYADYAGRRFSDSRGLLGTFEPWLRPGLSLDQATEIFWAVFSHETAEALVTDRGWTVEQYADWQVDALQRLLFSGAGRGAAR